MPLGVWNQEWLNANSQRKYPLADDASGISDSGAFTLPDDFIVELDIAVHAGLDVDPARFFIKHIGVYQSGYSVVVGYQPAVGDAVTVATAQVARQLHERNRAYGLGGSGTFFDAVGKVVIGRLDSIDEQAGGFHTFLFAAGRLDPDAIRPIIRGVSSLVVVNDGQRSRPIFGDVELVAGTNFTIDASVVDSVTRLTFNAVRGEGTVAECECTGDDASSPPIKTINGISPTEAGDFYLVGDKCVDITAISAGAKVSDSCGVPCCSCLELESITRDLERLREQSRAVTVFADRLQTAVETMDTVVLGSKLSDRGCFS